MKNVNTINLIRASFLLLIAVILLKACKDDDTVALSNDLRLLTATANGDKLTETAQVENEDLTIEIVFSHTLNTSAFENALEVSGSPDYTVRYDETNSFVTLTFERLEFDTDYTISLPPGSYGANQEMLKSAIALHFTTKAFVPPTLTLTSSKTGLLEGEMATITATLNKPTITDVNLALMFEGTAQGAGVDYEMSAESLTIPQGSTTATVTLTALNDADIEGEETVRITISTLENAVESTPQVLNLTLNDEPASLILKGVMAVRWASETDGNSGKAVHLVVLENIADLSVYGLGVANNGGGTDGLEFSLPAIPAAAGDQILVARDPAALEAYFGAGCYAEFDHVIQTDAMNQNGDDAIELYNGSAVIETFGDANVSGAGQPWEYTGSWAYKLGGTWMTGTPNCAAGSTSSMNSDCVYPLCDQPLSLKGVMAILWDGSGTNGGKAVHLIANRDIADLSLYSLGVANNGGGTDGIEYTFPSMAVSEGDHILLAREVNTLSAYFGSCFSTFDHVLESDAMNQNGDDAIELFSGSTLIETFGDANVDGTGQAWDYDGSWAYKAGGQWTYGGVGCAATSTTTQNSSCVYTLCE